MMSRKRVKAIEALIIISVLLILGLGAQTVFSWEGSTSNWTPGSFEEVDVNVTGDFYRDGVNFTQWIDDTYLLDSGAETLDMTGTFSATDINATGDFYRGGNNFTAWIDDTYLLDSGAETLDISGTFSATDINATTEFYRGGDNYTAWIETLIPESTNGINGYSYVIYKSGATYYALNYTGGQVNTDNDAEDIIEWVWSQADCGSFRTIGPGNWTLDATVDSQNDDVTWESDWSLTFSAEAGAFNDTSCISITHDRVTLIGLKVYGHMSSQPDHPGVWPGGPWNTQRGVDAHCDDLTVIRLFSYNNTQYGLYWGAGVNAIVTESVFQTNGWNGVEYGTGATLGRISHSYAVNNSDVQFALYGSFNKIEDCVGWGQGLNIGSIPYTWGVGIEGRDYNQIDGFTGYDLDIGVGIGADPTYSPQHWIVSNVILYNINNTAVQVGYGPGQLNHIRYNVSVASTNGIVISDNANDIEINDIQGYGENTHTMIKIDSQNRIRIKGGALLGSFTYGIELVGTCEDIAIIGLDIGVGGSANTGIIGGAADDVDDFRLQNSYIEATTGLDLDSGSRIFLTANKWDCTNPINVANANCNPVFMFLNDWDQSNNNASIAGATVVHDLNIATNGGVWDGT